MKDQSRNKAKDALSDYWKSNRETEKANAEALKKQQAGQTEQEKKRWKFSEKAMLVVIVLGLIGIVIRYVVF